MFQRFRYQSTQPPVSSIPESHDSPREEARPDTSVPSEVPHMADAVAFEEDAPAAEFDAPEQKRTGDTPQVGFGATADAHLPADDEPHDTGEDAEEDTDSPSLTDAQAPPPRVSRRRGRQLVKQDEPKRTSYTPEQRLLLLDTWRRSWRGKSQFTKHLEKRGIRQIVARPRRPQTLGKIERFWGTLWREFLEAAVFIDLADARTRIGHFVDDYNFHRVHRGIDGLVPVDRFFGAASDVARTLRERVAANVLELARHGAPPKPFYVTGQVDGQAFSVHAEGERLILRREDEPREEITLVGSEQPATVEPTSLPAPVCPQGAPASTEGEPADAPPPAPGTSALDALQAAYRVAQPCEGDPHEADSDHRDEQRERRCAMNTNSTGKAPTEKDRRTSGAKPVVSTQV